VFGENQAAQQEIALLSELIPLAKDAYSRGQLGTRNSFRTITGEGPRYSVDRLTLCRWAKPSCTRTDAKLWPTEILLAKWSRAGGARPRRERPLSMPLPPALGAVSLWSRRRRKASHSRIADGSFAERRPIEHLTAVI
jgi:hypothetical protein